MKAPSVNLNGDEYKTLDDECMAAIEAVQAAINAVGAMTIHGRNYPARQDDCVDAQRSRRVMLWMLKEVGTELADYYCEIVSQQQSGSKI